MPHKQKENHDHSTKSKKERQRAKLEADQRRKNKASAAAAKALEEAEMTLRNNLALVEGFGAYEIGCEPEKEHKFNTKKRSKKHLRNDLRLKAEREEREQEENRRRREEEANRGSLEEEKEEEEEEVIVEEYMVYICECCDKRYATKNSFLNHSNSKKHKDLVRIYEDLGLIVTHVELRGENGNEEDAYDDYEVGTEGRVDEQYEDVKEETDGTDDDDNNDEEEEVHVQQRQNLFAAFADDSSSSSSSSSESSGEDDDEEEDRKLPPASLITKVGKGKTSDDLEKEEKETDEDDIDFEELIHQNRLVQDQIDAENQAVKTNVAVVVPKPLPFEDDGYDPNDYGVNEKRLAAVQHRLQKRLAARGIEPSPGMGPAFAPSDVVAMGRTLLQEVMDAKIETLQAKLDAYNRHKKDCELLGREFARTKGNSKALSAQYVRKQDTADNARTRANVHHAGSHYHMQAARSMQFGRSKGMMARHSYQGARLQASRMAAKETSRMQSGGGRMKVGKTSKKSNTKKQGRAGGSKKTGGNKGDGE